MPVWAKWLSLIGLGFMGGVGSAQADGLKHTTGDVILKGVIGIATAVMGGATNTKSDSAPLNPAKVNGDPVPPTQRNPQV